VKKSHPKASILKGGRVVFNIKAYAMAAPCADVAGSAEVPNGSAWPVANRSRPAPGHCEPGK